jgi:hypothetical protein
MKWTTLAILVGLAASGLVSRPAGAAPVYDFLHHLPLPGYGSFPVGPQGTPIDYDFPYQELDTEVNGVGFFTAVHAQVGTGFVAISDHTYNNFIGSNRQEVTGRFLFEVFFASPTSDPIEVVLNLEFSGTVAPPFSLLAGIYIGAGVGGSPPDIGSYFNNQQGPPQISGVLSTQTMDGAVHSVSSGRQLIPVNQPVLFSIRAVSSNPFSVHPFTPGIPPEESLISINRFGLATSGNVFDLFGPNAGAIVVSSSDANIVENIFNPVVASVPSASPVGLALALLATGMLGLSLRKPSRKRVRGV